jgi:predicted glycogen debranching enzyme
MDISFDEKTCHNIKEALRLEWLDTNGLGGYSSSTILNCHSRRYHGLLIANLSNPVGRYVLLSKFEESILIKGREFFISFHKYPGIFSSAGYKYLVRFQYDLFPHFVYQIGNTIIRKSIMSLYGENTTLIEYFCERSDEPLKLQLKPFIAFRDHHALSKENLSLHVRTYNAKNGFKIQPYDGMPPLFLQSSIKSIFYPSPMWYRNFEYIVEAERGFDFHEDLFLPGVIELNMSEGDSVIISASTQSLSAIRNAWEGEKERRQKSRESSVAFTKSFKKNIDRDLLLTLVEQAKQFLIKQPVKGKIARPTIIAGYHWFTDWGRDTLISLPGLTFCIDQHDKGIEILKSIGSYEKNGLLPNYFAENGKDHAYNSVDCSLWYFWAVQQMLLYTGDLDTIRKVMWPVMLRIFEKFKVGTDHGIFMSKDGLLHAGNERTQLTWMDAVVNSVPVTPRNGYPVDINALWYNAVCFIDELAGKFGKERYRCPELIRQIKESFNKTFWIEKASYLGDVFHNDVLDPAFRPNQIFAVSLPYSPLDQIQAKKLVEMASKELLTPFGIRTLSPRDKAYQGKYSGDASNRDSAYHQGTAWPWLVGHFGEAYINVADNKGAAREFLLNTMRNSLKFHLMDAGLCSVSEIFDGDPPHLANGCIAQSWSVAEVIRLYILCTHGKKTYS